MVRWTRLPWTRTPPQGGLESGSAAGAPADRGLRHERQRARWGAWRPAGAHELTKTHLEAEKCSTLQRADQAATGCLGVQTSSCSAWWRPTSAHSCCSRSIAALMRKLSARAQQCCEQAVGATCSATATVTCTREKSERTRIRVLSRGMSREALRYAPCTEGCGAFSWRLSTELTAALPLMRLAGRPASRMNWLPASAAGACPECGLLGTKEGQKAMKFMR